MDLDQPTSEEQSRSPHVHIYLPYSPPRLCLHEHYIIRAFDRYIYTKSTTSKLNTSSAPPNKPLRYFIADLNRTETQHNYIHIHVHNQVSPPQAPNMCQMVLDICPTCKLCGSKHGPYLKSKRWHEPCGNAATAGPCTFAPNVDRQGNRVCRHCIFLTTQKKKNEDRKKKDDDKKKDKDKKAQAKVDKAARMKNFKSSNKAEGDAIKSFDGY